MSRKGKGHRMERDSLLYKLRRKTQVAARYVLSDETLSKIYYRLVLGKTLHLKDPKTFNEKIQWLKLYYYPNDKNVIKATDKYTARDYIKEKGYGRILNKLIGIWDDVNDINWEQLPSQFVLKCTHGCAYNIVVSNKEEANEKKIKKQLRKWQKEDFGNFNIEIHYSKIKSHRIICEEFLGDVITDYKFFCFNGEPQFIYVSTDLIHDRQAQLGFFTLDGEKIPLKRDDYADIEQMEKPSFFNDMYIAAKDLSQDFPFVRVDFFIANNTFYFAELTFTPGAGMMPFNPDSYDQEWGEMLHIEHLINNEDA